MEHKKDIKKDVKKDIKKDPKAPQQPISGKDPAKKPTGSGNQPKR